MTTTTTAAVYVYRYTRAIETLTSVPMKPVKELVCDDINGWGKRGGDLMQRED